MKKSPIKNFEVKIRNKHQNTMSKNNIYQSPSRKPSIDGN